MWLRTNTIDGRRVISFDGKTLRGARDGAGNLVHLLAGLCQTDRHRADPIAVGAKTNEIPMLRTLLDSINITGAGVTADALHCQWPVPRTTRPHSKKPDPVKAEASSTNNQHSFLPTAVY